MPEEFKLDEFLLDGDEEEVDTDDSELDDDGEKEDDVDPTDPNGLRDPE
ncbi:MAG: hypothetical protein NT019_01310 [Candidatus Adlerbacteria bacterium]|nr:hypothetical protein [Candidatus Adlerbacteria bacterium]